tara:strand:+ start:691 stop:801 length:111 start_codon:yes stop_codon:yes gene_type:complete
MRTYKILLDISRKKCASNSREERRRHKLEMIYEVNH